MSEVTALVSRLIAAGVEPGEAAEVIALAVIAGAANAPTGRAIEKRRAYDRERKRKTPVDSGGNRWNSALSTGIPVDSGGNPQPLARVEDKTSTSLLAGRSVVVIADAWPLGEAIQHAKLLVAEAAAPRLDLDKSPGLITSLGRIVAWRRDGASWQHDVLPTVTTLARQNGRPIKAWTYFDQAIADSIASNRRALEIPEHGAAPRRAAFKSFNEQATESWAAGRKILEDQWQTEAKSLTS